MRNQTTAERKLAEKIENTFSYLPGLAVDLAREKIVFWYGITERPPAYTPRLQEWTPYACGPLYGDSAIDACHEAAKRIEEYRSLLPKKVRGFAVEVINKDKQG